MTFGTPLNVIQANGRKIWPRLRGAGSAFVRWLRVDGGRPELVLHKIAAPDPVDGGSDRRAALRRISKAYAKGTRIRRPNGEQRYNRPQIFE